MGRPIIDMQGKRFGRLLVLEYAGKNRWKCLCDCGNVVYPIGSNLRSGDIRSCGCLRKEVSMARSKTHGKSGTRIHQIWKAMRARCRNKNNIEYKNYGARGIDLCKEWDNFENFYSWAQGNGYRDDLTIDRIDVNKGYSPDNCKWSTLKEQANNKRNSNRLTYHGETKTIAQWSEEKGMCPSTLAHRVKVGFPEDMLFALKLHNGGRKKKMEETT